MIKYCDVCGKKSIIMNRGILCRRCLLRSQRDERALYRRVKHIRSGREPFIILDDDSIEIYGTFTIGELEDIIKRAKLKHLSIEYAEFSVRTYNCVCSEGINMLTELEKYSGLELLKIKNFGMKCLKEVQLVMAKHGLKLRG